MKHCWTIRALANIGVAHRDPYPCTRRDHRSAFNAAVAKPTGAEAKMLTQLPRASSTMIPRRMAPDSHTNPFGGIPNRTQPSGSIH